MRRGARGAKVWRAHREHFYQRAVDGGSSHGRVALHVLACIAVLMACAGAAALGYGWPAMAVGALAVAVLLAILERRARPAA